MNFTCGRTSGRDTRLTDPPEAAVIPLPTPSKFLFLPRQGSSMASVQVHSMEDLPATGTKVQQVSHDYVLSWQCFEESVSYAEHSISVPKYNDLDYTLASNIITHGGLTTPLYPSTSLATPVYSWYCMPQLQPGSIKSEQLVHSSSLPLKSRDERSAMTTDVRFVHTMKSTVQRILLSVVGLTLLTSTFNPTNGFTDLSV